MEIKPILERIRFIRDLRGYSQEYVGEKLGIGQTGYSDLEHGKRKLDPVLLGQLAEILDVKESFFYQNGPLVVQVRDNQHNTNVGYNHVENQHMVPQAMLDRVLVAHEELIALTNRFLDVMERDGK